MDNEERHAGVTEKHTTTDDPSGWQPAVLVFVLSWAAWLLLAGTLSVDEILVGAVAALMVTLISGAHLAVFNGVRFTPMAFAHLAGFLAVFLRSLLYANIDMARRVLSPSLPIRPAMVQVETQLESALGKLLLTNAITLTPGTLSVEVHNQRLTVHWVDCPPGLDMEGKTRVIVSGFERHLRGFLK
jgi:multicomponent Na+:H+ antiporter subunit E